MKKLNIMLSLIAILAIALPTSAIQARSGGVDDLRGRWDITWEFDEFDPQPPIVLYINELAPASFDHTTYYVAAGCMRSPETDALMPLSLVAYYDPIGEAYDLSIYSTIVPPEGWEPFVMRLQGSIEVNGEGVTDDVAGGAVTTEFAQGTWSGEHHDRRKTKCPSVDLEQLTQADVRLQQDLAFDPPQTSMVFELYTVVVSSALQVELPDGSTRIVGQYTGLFSPDVDFIGRFRYFEDFEGESPEVGQPYKFTLLDIFGNPIPGTESTDVFSRCTLDAPRNITAENTFESDVTLNWDPVPIISDEFDPALQGPDSDFHLPYQVNIWSVNEEPLGEFGSLGQQNWHIVPWNEFEPGGPGLPDGFDFGQSLSTFENGLYQISIDSWNMPVTDQGGHIQDCMVFDSSENLFMEKSSGELTFTASGTISGTVTEDGQPVADVWVDACEYDNEEDPYCQGAQTNENGEYRITRLMPGDYRVHVWGGQGGWIDEFYYEKTDYNEATSVDVDPGAEYGGVNFTLEKAGSISGTVYDAEGNPLGGIGVDVEEGGYGTCSDENGFFSLDGLPLGAQVNVVAGRDFCGEHPFEEQIQTNITVGSTGVDFYLNEGYHPTLHVVPAHPEIHGHNWNPEAFVTIYIDNDDDLGNSVLYEASKLVTDDNWCGDPCFDITGVPELPNGILPGHVVTMTDGEATRIVHTTTLEWWGTDEETDTVFGYAEPGTWVEVTVHEPEWGQRMVQADGYGNWEADFTGILDLQPGYNGRSIQFEEGIPDDGTLAYWWIEEPEQPHLIAHPDHEWISGYGWTVGDVVTLCIDSTSGGCSFTQTQTASQSGDPNDDPNIGEVWFDNWAPFDLTPNMFVSLQGGSFIRDLQVEALSVDSFDDSTDTVFGTAPAGREVGVGVHGSGIELWQVVTAQVGGTWQADFSAEGVDFLLVEDIHAILWDGDGDATQANYNFP